VQPLVVVDLFQEMPDAGVRLAQVSIVFAIHLKVFEQSKKEPAVPHVTGIFPAQLQHR
jgi:hypothetical protein